VVVPQLMQFCFFNYVLLDFVGVHYKYSLGWLEVALNSNCKRDVAILCRRVWGFVNRPTRVNGAVNGARLSKSYGVCAGTLLPSC
jgi:hypothetical protein